MLHQLIFLNKYKYNRGYVALMSVLVISAVGVVVSVSLLTLGMIYQSSSSTLEKGYKAEALAKACANIALEKIHSNALYGGDENVNFENDHCEILPIIKVGDTYTIKTHGIVNLTLRKNKIVVLRTEYTEEVILDINTWQEIADF